MASAARRDDRWILSSRVIEEECPRRSSPAARSGDGRDSQTVPSRHRVPRAAGSMATIGRDGPPLTGSELQSTCGESNAVESPIPTSPGSSSPPHSTCRHTTPGRTNETDAGYCRTSALIPHRNAGSAERSLPCGIPATLAATARPCPARTNDRHLDRFPYRDSFSSGPVVLAGWESRTFGLRCYSILGGAVPIKCDPGASF